MKAKKTINKLKVSDSKAYPLKNEEWTPAPSPSPKLTYRKKISHEREKHKKKKLHSKNHNQCAPNFLKKIEEGAFLAFLENVGALVIILDLGNKVWLIFSINFVFLILFSEVYNTIHDEKRHKVVVEEEMEEAKGVVKHVLLAKFKDDVTPERIEELIKDYANLVNLIPPMKSFHWYLLHVFLFFLTLAIDLGKQYQLLHKLKIGAAKTKPNDKKNWIFNKFIKMGLPRLADEWVLSAGEQSEWMWNINWIRFQFFLLWLHFDPLDMLVVFRNVSGWFLLRLLKKSIGVKLQGFHFKTRSLPFLHYRVFLLFIQAEYDIS